MVGRFQVFLAGGEIVAFHVGLLAVHQVQVSHGVVVVGAKLDGLVQAVDALLDRGSVLFLQLGANFLLIFVLGIQALVRLHSELRALFHSRLIAGGPVDHAHRVVGLGIVGVDIGGHAVILLGLIELLHVQIKVCDALGGIHLLIAGGVHVEDALILLDGLFRHFIVVRSIGAGNVLLGEGSGQIHFGIDETWIQRNGLLKMVDRFFVLGVLVSGHALVELIAGPQLATAHGR